MVIQKVVSALRSQPLLTLGAVAVLTLGALWVLVAWLRPLPPRAVVMATGPEGSTYHELGKRYRELLGRSGITVQLQPTAGDLENLARLRDPRSGVQISVLHGGLTSERESPGLVSLGTLFYEPLWFFYLREYRGTGMAGLRGRKMSIGLEGSGTRALALELLARNGIDHNFAELLALPPAVAGAKLLSGQIDAALMLTAWDAPEVRQLLTSDRIDVVSFPRADAYIALYPYLTKLVVPAGVADLAKNQPPTDVVLFAPKASLVVREDLHPAVQYLLLDAATQLHARPGIFQRAGQFPAAESIDLPLSEGARQFYRNGRPFLQRHLPFWLAVLADRLLILIIPIVGVIYPLVRFLPSVYGMRIQQRIYRLYGELKLLENEAETRQAKRDLGDLLARLDGLENRANRVRVPVFYASLMYTVRAHIGLVRQRVKNLAEHPTTRG